MTTVDWEAPSLNALMAKIAADTLTGLESTTVFIGPPANEGPCEDCGQDHWTIPVVALRAEGPTVGTLPFPAQRSARSARAAFKDAALAMGLKVRVHYDDLAMFKEAQSMWPSELLARIIADIEQGEAEE